MALLERETLDADEVMALAHGSPLPKASDGADDASPADESSSSTALGDNPTAS
jgi:hypothetical protein